MGKASSSKKVARAASTGGGRTSRGRTPWLWYTSMTLVVLLGSVILWISRSDLDQAAADPPAIGKDHWHAAFGVYVCDKFLPNLPDKGDRVGIHSHADGLMHIEPSSRLSAGKNARLKLFLDGVGIKLTSTSLEVPDQPVRRNGAKCGGKPARVRVVEWRNPGDEAPTDVSGDPNRLRLRQAQVVAVAFVPEGTDVPQPPAAKDITEAGEPGAPMPSTPGPPPTGGEPTGAPEPTSAPAPEPEPTVPGAPPPNPATSTP